MSPGEAGAAIDQFPGEALIPVRSSKINHTSKVRNNHKPEQIFQKVAVGRLITSSWQSGGTGVTEVQKALNRSAVSAVMEFDNEAGHAVWLDGNPAAPEPGDFEWKPLLFTRI
ncbi:MAG: hypothetical protein HRF49_08040 [bacterium]